MTTTRTFCQRGLPAAACVVLSLLCVSCPESTTNPVAPGAEGIVGIADGIDVTGGASLELRFYPSNCANLDTLYPEVCDVIPGFEKQSFMLGAVQFPYDFSLGPEGVGATSQQDWYILAWVASATGAERPQTGEFYGIAPVSLNDCTPRCLVTCYCGRIHNIEVLINTIAD